MVKIVIAEDEPDIRELIAFTLRFAGYEVIAGSNGQEGYDLTKKERPDLAMFDVRMPRMTGYDACKMIKADPEIAHIPVIFLSAKGQESEIEQGLAAGADDYLLKPFAPDQLTERVKVVLAKYGK
jgi:DNA-binding response OmpR family regulator